jgi:quinol monooxygenase YgiN
MVNPPKVGFVAIYHWRIYVDQIDSFLAAWETVTRCIKAERGGLGSKIHRADDGTFVAYAQWPDRETWQAMGKLPSVDPEASKAMRAAIEESLPSLYLDPINDLLEH